MNMAAPKPRRVASNLERVLASNALAVTAEIAPNASGSPEQVRSHARALRTFVDACNVTDNQRAQVKISSLAAAALLLKEGLEPVMQLVTRDRNRIALQSDLLGAHALGVRNVLCLSGDDPRSGNEPDATPVYEFTTERLLAAAKKMRDSAVLAGGAPVEDPPNFLLGATASPSAAELEEAVVNVRGKVDAGADFIQTQAVYDLDAFEEWMRLVRKEWLHEKVSILAGVLPIKSVKMARFLDEKVPGISVPRFVMERMTKSGDAKAEGIRIALETIERLREIDGIRGVHIMAVGWEDVVPTIVQKAGLHPRPI